MNKKINILRPNRGGEYRYPFSHMCAKFGIIHLIITPYTPKSNGVAKWKNNISKDMIIVMLINSDLLDNLWDKALHMSNYILNKMPYKKIPFHVSYGKEAFQTINISKCGGIWPRF